MADVFETRSLAEGLSGSTNLMRVACIGDSMMYGQGVVPRETLPAHLDRLLNAAWLDDLVWVDNFGETSGNLWHAWTRMKARALSRHFDAIVFSVCHNDAQPFESNTVPYGSDKLAYWQTGSPYFELAIELFADFAEFCRTHGIVPVVLFYTYIEEDRPIVETLRDLLQQLALPFVDSLAFLQQQTGVNVRTYQASEFDGHPSGLAHELVARGVAARLSKLMEGRCPGVFGKDPARALSNALCDLIDQHVAPDVAVEWARQALAAKERSARRRRGVKRSAGLVETAGDLVAGVGRLQARWYSVRRLETALAHAALPDDYQTAFLPQIYAALRNLDEAVFLIDKSRNAADVARLGRLFPPEGFYDEKDRLGFFTGSVAEEIAGARSRLTALLWARSSAAGSFTELTSGGNALMRDSLDITTLHPAFPEMFAGIARFQEHLATLERTATRVGAIAEDDGVRRIWGIIFFTVRAYLYYLEHIDRLFADLLPPPSSAASAWTCVDVVIEGGPDPSVPGHVCLLQVEADYRVPRRPRLRDQRWAGVAKDRAAYHFELPLMLLGDLRVGIGRNEPTRDRFANGTTRIARIEIYNGPAEAGAQSIGESRPTVSWSEPDSRLSLIAFPNILLH